MCVYEPASASKDCLHSVERSVAVAHDEGHVGQLTASEGHLEILSQLVTVAVFLVDTVQHRRWRSREGKEKLNMMLYNLTIFTRMHNTSRPNPLSKPILPVHMYVLTKFVMHAHTPRITLMRQQTHAPLVSPLTELPQREASSLCGLSFVSPGPAWRP